MSRCRSDVPRDIAVNISEARSGGGTASEVPSVVTVWTMLTWKKLVSEQRYSRTEPYTVQRRHAVFTKLEPRRTKKRKRTIGELVISMRGI